MGLVGSCVVLWGLVGWVDRTNAYKQQHKPYTVLPGLWSTGYLGQGKKKGLVYLL